MAVLLTILWSCLALLILLVAVPFHASALASVHDASPDARARLDWAWGLVALQAGRKGVFLHLCGVRIGRIAWGKHADKKEKAEERGKEGALGWRSAGAMAGHRNALSGVVARLARALRLRLRIRGLVGMGDPADTAQLIALARALKEIPGLELDLSWEWIEEELEVDARGSARIWILQLVFVTAGLMMARQNRALLRAVRGK